VLSRRTTLTGLAAFLLVWVTQFLSVLGTQMTQFALTLWIYEGTERVSALALQQVFYYALPAGDTGRGIDGRPLQPQVDDDDQ